MEVEPVKRVQSNSRIESGSREQRRRNPAPPQREHRPEPPSRFEVVAENGNEVAYRTVDPETGLVLSQLPSEEVRRVAARLQQMMDEGTIRECQP